MASKLSSFHPPVPISTTLLKNGPDNVPSVEELERLQAELMQVKQRALDRARKAKEDLKTLEESMHRMTEREKGKYKAIERVKRERDCQYILRFTLQWFLTSFTVLNSCSPGYLYLVSIAATRRCLCRSIIGNCLNYIMTAGPSIATCIAICPCDALCLAISDLILMDEPFSPLSSDNI